MPAKQPKSQAKSPRKSTGKSPRKSEPQQPTLQPTSSPRVQPLAANGEIRLTANDLRALAEEADGLRDADAVVIRNPNTGLGQRPYKIVREGDARSSGVEPVLRLRTDNKPPFAERRPPLILSSEPAVTLASHPNLTLGHCDAVFTSISAVDKFVIPYYQRMRELSAVQAAREKYATDTSALAVVHLPQSVDDTLMAAGSVYAVVGAPMAAAALARGAPGAAALAQGVQLRGFIDDYLD